MIFSSINHCAKMFSTTDERISPSEGRNISAVVKQALPKGIPTNFYEMMAYQKRVTFSQHSRRK